MMREKTSVLCLLFVGALVAAGAGCRTVHPPMAVSDEALARATVTMADDFDGKLSWELEDWGDGAEVSAAPSAVKGAKPTDLAMVISMKMGEKGKCVVSRDLGRPRDLSKYNAIIVDVTSELEADCLVGVGLIVSDDGKFIETLPAVVHPGANRNIVFRLDQRDFKSVASDWQHNEPAGDLSAVSKVVVLISPKAAGAVRVDNLRLAVFPK